MRNTAKYRARGKVFILIRNSHVEDVDKNMSFAVMSQSLVKGTNKQTGWASSGLSLEAEVGGSIKLKLDL